jgi:hypothetical protein
MSEKSSTVSLNNETNAYQFDASFYGINGESDAVKAGKGTPTVNLLRGGQWGHLPMIGVKENGKYRHAWMSDQAYIRRDIIPVVLQVPKGFELLPHAEYFKKACVSLFEKHARTIEGLDSSLTVNVGEHELGLEGGKYQEPVNVTVAESNVSISLTEKYGQAVKNFLDVWIRYLIMDPQTKSPLISKFLVNDKEGNIRIEDHFLNNNVWSTEYYTMTVLFIEPDILNARVVNAWLVSNMFPRTVPNIIGKKDKKADKEIEELSIEFGGFALHSRNTHVRKMAQDALDKLKLYNLTNDNILPATNEIDPVLTTTAPGDSLFFDQTGDLSTTLYTNDNTTLESAE